MEKIIFVGSSWIFAKYIGLASHLLGYEPVFLGDMNFYSKDVRETIQQYEHYNVNINSVDDMLNLIHKKNIKNIVGITTSADSKLKNAIQLAERLNVKGPDRTILALTDKNEVAKIIPEYSPEAIVFSQNKIPYDDIQAIFKRNGPLVLKPTQGSGATGVIHIITQEDVKNIPQHLAKFNLETWILQKAIEGELYSVEGYCLNGKIKILGFTLRDRIKTTEMTNHFPAENIINHKIQTASLTALQSLVKRSGYKNGYFHCEFLSDGKRVYLIDANFGRMGGGAIIEQIAVAFNERPEKLAAHIISVGLFNQELNNRKIYESFPRETLSINFGLEDAAQFIKVIKPKNTENYYTTVANENAHIESIGTDDYAWVGILAGEKDKVLAEIKNFKIQTDKAIVAPKYFVRKDHSKTCVGGDEL